MCKSQRSKVCEEIYHLTIVFNVFTITCIELQLYIQFWRFLAMKGTQGVIKSKLLLLAMKRLVSSLS